MTKEISNVTCLRVIRWVEEGNIALGRALPAPFFRSLVALDDMRLLLNQSLFGGRCVLKAHKVFSVRSTEKNVKEFCGELLDRCVPNPWKTTLRQVRACLSTRLTVASSLFSVRKVICLPKPDWRAYVDKMTQPQSYPDLNFVRFAVRETERIFSSGWDKGYWSQVGSFAPPTKSNRTKEIDGCYRQWATRNALSREVFLRWAGGTVTTPIDDRVRATAVETGGKWRVITLADMQQSHLLPLHRTIYNRLAKEKWLLRGEACAKSFEGFERKEGEVFVSGDYESATDNLNVHVTRAVLRRLLSTATHIPLRVREEAMDSLERTFVDKRGLALGKQVRGQLMGNPLSFPLLCLINYLTFRFAVRREVPVKINGDDIVFRATESERDSWFRQVRLSGLVVSLGKTLVHGCIFSLNSTYFRSSDMGVTRHPLIRASSLKKCEDMVALTGALSQIRRDLKVSEIRENMMCKVLRTNLHVVYPSQGSIGRRFRCHVPKKLLIKLGLYERESFYRDLPEEPKMTERFSGFVQDVIPSGWRKTKEIFRGDRRLSNQEVTDALIFNSWSAEYKKETRNEFWERVRDKSFKYVCFSKKIRRLFSDLPVGLRGRGGFESQVNKRNYPRVPCQDGEWVEKSGVVESLRAPVAFRRGGVE